MILMRHPELAPLPLGPRRGTPDPAATWLAWRAGNLPLLGQTERVAGQDLVAVTFALLPRPGTEWIVHLNSITDAHRHTLGPSRLEPIGDTALLGCTLWLPSQGIFSYRMAEVTGLPDDIGSDRAGWLRVHRNGIADPANPHRMPTPLGPDASVWVGPEAPWPHWKPRLEPTWVHREVAGVQTRVLPGSHEVVVVFDLAHWADLGLGAAVRAAGLGHTVVLLDSGDHATREARLSNPEAAAAHTCLGLRVAGEVLGRRVDQAFALAGQSFGGLATAAVLAHHPELAAAGVVQSGSFWHGARAGDRAEIGRLLRGLRAGKASVERPVIIQVGTAERDLLPLNRGYRDALAARGANFGYREVVGGHDYAWWRWGLLEALIELADTASTI